jgi:hypothetical protein
MRHHQQQQTGRMSQQQQQQQQQQQHTPSNATHSPQTPQYSHGQSQPQQEHNHQTHPQSHQHHHHSSANEKYAAMANQTEDGQANTTRIKHDILLQWALLPPQLQTLRPIDALITTIHNVFPPALGVPGHEYFEKWKPIAPADIVGKTGHPDEEKMKKAVRKVRFFLHPDKLPHDLTDEQRFTCKLLWDVTSDAFEDYQKFNEELDWVK